MFVSGTDIAVEVQELSASDKGKGIARLDVESMKLLGIPSGGIVEVQGQRKAYVKCLRDEEDNHSAGILRVDMLVRNNAKINLGSRIYVKRSPVVKARKVVLAPLDVASFTDESAIKDALKSFPIIQDSNVAIMSLGEPLFFRIVETIPPDRPLIITSDTMITIGEYYFLEPDKSSDDDDDNPEITISDEEFTESEFLEIKDNLEV